MSTTGPDERLQESGGRGGPLVTLIAAVVLVGTSVSIGFHYVCGAYLGMGYPYNTFLFAPWARFSDLYQPLLHARTFNAVAGSGIVDYSPLSQLVLTACSPLPDDVTLGLFVATFLTVLVLLVRRTVVDVGGTGPAALQNGFILCAMTYPVMFVIDRGNLEMLVFVLLAGFVYLCCLRRSRWSWVPLGMAIGLKLHPATLIVVLLAERRWREAAYAMLLAVGLNVGAVLALGWLSGFGAAGVLERYIRSMSTMHTGGSGLAWGVVNHGHSLWAAIGLAYGLSGAEQTPAQLAGAYTWIVAALFAGVSLYVIFVERVAWKRVALLVMCFLLFPYSSHDYTLIHVLPVITLFALAGERSRFDRVYAVLLGSLLIPLDYVYFQQFSWRGGNAVFRDIGISALLYPALIVAFMALVIYEGFRMRGRAGA